MKIYDFVFGKVNYVLLNYDIRKGIVLARVNPTHLRVGNRCEISNL